MKFEAGSAGAAFHPGLQVPPDASIVNKGVDPKVEAYSGFQGTGLEQILRSRGIRRVFVCGLATDYCVKHTALDALKYGFAVVIIEDACRAVNIPAGSGAAALEELCKSGGQLVHAPMVAR